MRFSGAPAKRPRKWSDQAMWKPQLAGRSGATPSSSPAQAPSEPSRGQEAPPSASTVAAGRSMHRPFRRLEGERPILPAQPAMPRPQRDAERRRAAPSQARSSGEAFIARGKTRPELPMKVGWPSPSAQAVRAAGGKASMNGASRSPRRAVAGQEGRQRLGMRQVQPAAAGDQQLAGRGGHAVQHAYPRPAAGPAPPPPSARRGRRRGPRSGASLRMPPSASRHAAF